MSKHVAFGHINLFLDQWVDYLREHDFAVSSSMQLALHRNATKISELNQTEELREFLKTQMQIPTHQHEAFDQLWASFTTQESKRKRSKLENGVREVGGLLKVLSHRRFYLVIQLFLLVAIAWPSSILINCYIQEKSVSGAFRCFDEQFKLLEMSSSKTDQTADSPEELPIPAPIPEQEPRQRKEQPAEVVTSVESPTQEGGSTYRLDPRQVPEVKVPLELPREELMEEDISHLEAKWHQKYALLLKLLGILFILTAFAFHESYRYSRKQLVWIKEQNNSPPYFWPIKLPINELAYWDEKAFETTQIAATPGPPDGKRYLLLIEKCSDQDHLAMLVDQWVRQLLPEGTYVERYFYDQTPDIAWKEKFVQEQSLKALNARFPDYKLLICGNSDTFFSPISGHFADWVEELERWEQVTVFNLKELSAWGRLEYKLLRQLSLLPLSYEALKLYLSEAEMPAFDYWIANNDAPPVPQAEAAESMQRISAYFDTRQSGRERTHEDGSGKALLTWMGACAIYPELSWDLSLRLGQVLEAHDAQGRISPDQLLKLYRIPWFRQGEMPDKLRENLIKALSGDMRRKIRKEVVAILETYQPPEGSFAEVECQLFISLQKATYETGLSAKIRLIREAQDYALYHEIKDRLLVEQLDKMAKAVTRWSLPRRFNNVIFRQGMPALGLKRWVRAAMTFLLMFLLVLTLDPNRLDRLKRFGGKDYFLQTKEDYMHYYTHVGNVYVQDSLNFEAGEINYRRSMDYAQQVNDSLYLKPVYNRAIAKLRKGELRKAEESFSEVQSMTESLLAQNYTLDESNQEDLRKMKSSSAYQRGVINYRSQEFDQAKEQFIIASDENTELLDALHGRLIVNIQQAFDAEPERQDLLLKLALLEAKKIKERDSLYFARRTTLKPVLDSLYQEHRQDSMGEKLRELLAVIDNQELEVRPPVDTFTQLTIREEGLPQSEYELIPPFDDNGYARIRQGDKYGFVFRNDSIVVEPVYDQVFPFSQGLAAVKAEGKWGYISLERRGNIQVPLIFDEVRDFQEVGGQLFASVKRRDKWGLMKLEGRGIREISKFIYDEPIRFFQGEPFAVVNREQRYGFMDASGKEVIRPRFDRAQRFFNTRARVVLEGKAFVINRKGECISGDCPPEKWIADPFQQYHSRTSTEFARFSPSDNLVIIAARDSTAKLWSVDRGEVVTVFRGHTDWVRSAAFSANGERVITASRDGTVKIWNLAGGLIETIFLRGIDIWEASFSPKDDNLIAVAGADATARVYDLREPRRPKLILRGHRNTVNTLYFSESGDSLISASEDASVRIWSAETGALLYTIETGSPVLVAKFAKGKRWIAAGMKSGRIGIWDIEGKEILNFRAHTNWVSDISFSSDNRYLLSTSYDKRVKVRNLQSGAEVLDLGNARTTVRSGSFSKDGKYILTASREGKVHLWALTRP